MADGWSKMGADIGAPDFQETIRELTNFEPEADPESWIKFTNFANTELDAWLDGTDGQNFMSSLSNNTETSDLVSRVTDIDEMDPEDVTPQLEADASELGSIVGSYWAMKYGELDDTQREILKSAGLYNEVEDVSLVRDKDFITSKIADGTYGSYDDLNTDQKKYVSENDFTQMVFGVVNDAGGSLWDGNRGEARMRFDPAIYSSLYESGNVAYVAQDLVLPEGTGIGHWDKKEEYQGFNPEVVSWYNNNRGKIVAGNDGRKFLVLEKRTVTGRKESQDDAIYLLDIATGEVVSGGAGARRPALDFYIPITRG